MNDSASFTSVRARRPRTWLRLTIMLLFLALLAAALLGFHRFKSGILKQVVQQIVSQVPTVATATASAQQWQPQLHAVGTLRASSGTDIAPEIGGIVDEIHFESGQEVAAGALLLRLRPNDDDAKLAQLQATADLAGVTYRRDVRQLQAQGVAQSVVDTDAANLKAAQAQVAAQQALMAEKVIRAPFAGRLGVRLVDRGQYLSPGTAIVTLQALDPIFVDFYLPQQETATIRPGQSIVVRSDSAPGRDFPGVIIAISPKVDAASRMVQVRASLQNGDKVLLSGMFVAVTVDAGGVQPHVTIPQTAVAYNPYGSVVFVVQQDGTDAKGHPKLVARQRFVTTGETRGDQVAVVKGIQAGDQVVTAGQIKLRNGSGLLIDNSVVPTDDPNPAPQDR